MPTKSQASPAHRIRSLSVVGGFLDNIDLEFAEGFNCIIGAFASGKTSIVEFLRYALDSMPTDPVDAKRVESLVSKNLGDGQIRLEIETKNGFRFIVQRSWGEEPIVLTADERPTELTLKSGGIFNVNVLSQTEIVRLSDSPSWQLELIDNFAVEEIREINDEIRRVQALLKTNASQIQPFEEQLESLSEQTGNLPNVEQKLKTMTEASDGTTTPLDKAHAHKALRDQELGAIQNVRRFLQERQRDLNDLPSAVEYVRETLTANLLTGPNRPILAPLAAKLQSGAQTLDNLIRSAKEQVETDLATLANASRELGTLHADQEAAYRKLLEKDRMEQGRAVERARWEKLRTELLAKQHTWDETSKKVTRLTEERRELLGQLSALRDQRFAVRERVAKHVSERLAPTIRTQVIQYGNPEPYRRLLEESLKAARLKPSIIAERIVAAFAPADLVASVRNRDRDALIDRARLTKDQADKALVALSDSRQLFELEAVDLHDQPRIELQEDDDYKSLDEMSQGQKCTAILPIVLLESDVPLLLDEPEQNLDTRFITETVVECIRRVKKQRQLIIVTHNANIPVVGEADRIFRLAATKRQARLVASGGVDEYRDHVVGIMEGGKQAFEFRMKKYGY